MQHCTIFILIALVVCSNAQHNVNLDDSKVCKTASLLKSGENTTVFSNGSIPFGNETCVVKLGVDSEGTCGENEVLRMCVKVDEVQQMCYPNVFFTDIGKKSSLNVDCNMRKPDDEWCTDVVAGEPGIQIEAQKHASNRYKAYKFTATVTSGCVDTRSGPTKGAQSEAIHDEYSPVDLEESLHQSRVVGIVVGCCLALMFLIALFVTYFYYKNKAYTGVPQDA